MAKQSKSTKNAAPTVTYKVVASNRRAYHEYFVEQKYTAGVVLASTEVKSIRGGKINLSDAYCLFKGDELWLRNVHIAEYYNGGMHNHETKRERKLLLQRRELRKLQSKVKERGFAIVPLEVLLTDRNLIKIEIALVKGKKSYDKRESIKERDVKRAMDRFE